MFWKKNKPEIIFECNNWAIRKYAPIRPSSEFVPDKFKNLPTILKKEQYSRDNIYSIKICPGLQDYIGHGYVIPAWCDMDVKIDSNNHPQVTYSDPELKHATHYPEQVGDFLDTKFPIRTPVKLDNPWFTYTKKDWSIMYLPMHFHENPYFEAIPGVIDHDKGPGRTPLNIMLKTNKDFMIKQGTPLVQMIPYKRQVVTSRSGILTNKTIDRYNSLIKTRFLTFKGWRWFMTEKKHFKIDQHDLEIPNDTD